MLFGLKDKDVNGIRQVLSGFPKVEEAVIFGSRAKGNYKPGSDIDLALKGKGLALSEVYEIDNQIDELNLPYTFDLLIFDQISDPAVVDHVNRVGLSFYKKP